MEANNYIFFSPLVIKCGILCSINKSPDLKRAGNLMIISNFGSQASPGQQHLPSACKFQNFTINPGNVFVQSCYTFYQGAVKRMPG
jgi:hypothetical protein